MAATKYLIACGIILGGLFAFWTTLTTMNMSIQSDNGIQSSQNSKIKKEIEELSAGSTDKINSALAFYREYFQARSEIYILDIFGLLEYALPDNNFVQSLSLTKNSVTVTLSFQAKDIPALIKLYYNLEEIKKKQLITKYSISDITLNQREGLKSAELKTYKIDIGIDPNVDRKTIVEFLTKQDPMYNSIYNNLLKEIKYSGEKMTDKVQINQAINNISTGTSTGSTSTGNSNLNSNNSTAGLTGTNGTGN